jgi:sugar O-acyltransferase (sialic acid O-acetyltransferase NeuD family)
MILYGASGHAKVIIDCLDANGLRLQAIFDDNPDICKLLDYKVSHQFDPDLYPGEPLIISIGNNEIRKRIASKLSVSNPPPTVLRHPSAIVSELTEFGDGSVILHNAVIQSSTVTGRYCIVNTGATVDHDCNIGDFCHIAPNATLCGGITIGEGSIIGAGSVVIPTIHIGKWCVIGAGSVIIKDVPDYAVVVGNPGRVVKKLDAE